MPTAEKIATVDEIADVLKRSRGIYLADFTGLDVPRFTALRKQLRDEKVAFRVVKNRLTLLALRKAGIEGFSEQLVGPTGLVSTEEDGALPARLLADFAKGADGKPVIKAGLIEGKVYGEAELVVLAKLPGRDVLIAQVVSTIASPLTGLVFTLNGLLSKFVRTLNAVAEKRLAEGGGPGAAPEAVVEAAPEATPGPASETSGTSSDATAEEAPVAAPEPSGDAPTTENE